MKVILHSKSTNEQCQKPTSRQIKPSAKKIIFHLQSDTSLNDESCDEIDFGVNILDNESGETNQIHSGNLRVETL